MRYFSLLYAPEERRDRCAALYVIDAEIRESSRSANHDVAHTRLQWWRAEIDRLVNGNPQHPATRLLNERRDDRTAFSKLHEALVAADMDLARMTYSNMQRAARLLLAQRRRDSGTDGGAARRARRRSTKRPRDRERIGVGVRLSEILRDLRQDAYDGRVYLPQDRLTGQT